MLTVIGVLLGVVLGAGGAVGLGRVRERHGWRRSLPVAILMAAVVVAFMVVDDRNDEFPWPTTALLTAFIATHLVQLRRAADARREVPGSDHHTR